MSSAELVQLYVLKYIDQIAHDAFCIMNVIGRGCSLSVLCFGAPLRGALPVSRKTSFVRPRINYQRVHGGRSDLYSSNDALQPLRATYRRALKQLSSLRLAIAELFAIAGLSAVGTVISQNETTEYYVQNYPGTALGLPISRCRNKPHVLR